MLQFLTPWAFGLLLLMIPILLFCLGKERWQKEPVSTLFFWREILEERRAFRFWRRWHSWIALLLSTGMVILLVGAIANPVLILPSKKNDVGRVVVIVDNSASMSVVEESTGLSRLDLVKKLLRRSIATWQGETEVTLWTAGGVPRKVAGPTKNGPLLLNAVERLKSTDLPAALAQTIGWAERAIDEAPDVSRILLSDGCSPVFTNQEAPFANQDVPFTNQEAPFADKNIFLIPNGESSFFSVEDLSRSITSGRFAWRERWNLLKVGAASDDQNSLRPLSNVAITRFQPRRSLADPAGVDVLIETANFSLFPAAFRLILSWNGSPVDVVPLQLSPNETKTTCLKTSSDLGGLLTATLESIQFLQNPTASTNGASSLSGEESASIDGDFSLSGEEFSAGEKTPENGELSDKGDLPLPKDALVCDNQATAILPERPWLKILYYGPDDEFLKKGILAQPRVKWQSIDSIPKTVPADSLLILNGPLPGSSMPSSVDQTSGSLPNEAMLDASELGVLTSISSMSDESKPDELTPDTTKSGEKEPNESKPDGAVEFKIPAGNVFLINPVGSCEFLKTGAVLERPRIVWEEPDSSLFRFASLKKLELTGARQWALAFMADPLPTGFNASGFVEPFSFQNGPDAKFNRFSTKTNGLAADTNGSATESNGILAESNGPAPPPQRMIGRLLAKTADDDPLMVAWESADTKCLALDVDLEQGDFVLQTAFPLFLSNVLDWFRTSGNEWGTTYRCGQSLTINVSEKTDSVWLQSPDSNEPLRNIPVTRGVAALGVLDQVGHWIVLDSQGQTLQLVPCFLGDAAESNLISGVKQNHEGNSSLTLSPSGQQSDAEEGIAFLKETGSQNRGKKGISTDLADRKDSLVSAQTLRSRALWPWLTWGVLIVSIVEWLGYRRHWFD